MVPTAPISILQQLVACEEVVDDDVVIPDCCVTLNSSILIFFLEKTSQHVQNVTLY